MSTVVIASASATSQACWPPGAAEAVERIAGHVITARDGDGLDRLGHLGDRDRQKSVGDRLLAPPVADLAGKRRKALAHDRRIERLVAARTEHFWKKIGDELAGHQVGVGDRERAAAAISGRAGIGAGGSRADAKARAVECEDRAAAGGDGMDLHHRRAHPDARDFGLEGALELSIEMGDVGRSPAHVEADHAPEAGARAGARHRHHAAGGPGQDRVLAGEELGRREAARRHHEHHARPGPLNIEIARHLADVASQDRRQIGVDHRRVAAPDELDEGGSGMAFRNLGEAEVARDGADDALMGRIAPGVHEHDRDGVIAFSLRLRERGAHAFGVRRRLDRTVREHALVDLDYARIELLGLYNVAGKDFGPRLIADLERVAEAARGHEQGALAAPFEQRVGRDRRPHLDDPDRPRRYRLARGEPEQAADRFDRRVGIGGTLGQELDRMQPPARIAPDHVGEGAAAVDPEIPGPGGRPVRGWLPVHV